MAQDCYKLFKTTFAQAKADGYTDSVATTAAQTAMDNCLKAQNARPTTVATTTTVTENSRTDGGPIVPARKR